MISRPSIDLVRHVLVVLVISLMIAGSLWVMRPFLPALIWATMIVVATWPLLLKVQAAFGDKRLCGVIVMTLAMLLVIVLPFTAAILTLLEHAGTIGRLVTGLPTYSLPPPPDWVPGIPLIGEKVEARWQELSAAGPGSLLAHLQPYAAEILNWIWSKIGSVGILLLHLLLTLIIAVILYARGEFAGRAVIRFARRLSGDRGEFAVRLGGQAIRAVALGIVVTAIVQSLLGGIGLWVAGVPYAALLSAMMMMLCIAQVGPFLPLIVGVAWLYWQGQDIWATALIGWTILVGMLDNIMRPLLIKRGAHLPLLLILCGVIGGMFAFGLVGLFVGPVVLAVTYTLLQAWINEAVDNPLSVPDRAQIDPRAEPNRVNLPVAPDSPTGTAQ
ncbi:AI-2E family transporter YdiK [Dongia soli]|uniref:AI-2E family transporter YdiK n=1 Tax=Dongia soli TaxID=600628 RepID=A0ABU5E6H3_9PROT|nr:AI-2E family transporter YdiK [Dongia soli]MDY0881319.1 AI-2E family transporter YdiK [Dongia soli]